MPNTITTPTPTPTPSVERQRTGHFNLYVPRRDGEPVGQRSLRGQFDSLAAASGYAKDKFNVVVELDALHLK